MAVGELVVLCNIYISRKIKIIIYLNNINQQAYIAINHYYNLN